MPAMTPEDICRLFQQFMAKGDLDAVMSVYDPEAVFLNQSREVTKSREELRRELAPLAAAKTAFDFNVKQIIQTGNIALMHTEWKVSGPQPMTGTRSRSLVASPTDHGAGSSAIPTPLAGKWALKNARP